MHRYRRGADLSAAVGMPAYFRAKSRYDCNSKYPEPAEDGLRALFGLFVVAFLVSPGFIAPAAAQCNFFRCCDPTTGRCWSVDQRAPDTQPFKANGHHHRPKHVATPKVRHAPKDRTQYLRYQ